MRAQELGGLGLSTSSGEPGERDVVMDLTRPGVRQKVRLDDAQVDRLLKFLKEHEERTNKD